MFLLQWKDKYCVSILGVNNHRHEALRPHCSYHRTLSVRYGCPVYIGEIFKVKLLYSVFLLVLVPVSKLAKCKCLLPSLNTIGKQHYPVNGNTSANCMSLSRIHVGKIRISHRIRPIENNHSRKYSTFHIVFTIAFCILEVVCLHALDQSWRRQSDHKTTSL